MKKLERCPYWDQVNKQDCKMTKGGLYIPLPEHIDIFCSSSYFTQCFQYIRGCELLKEPAQNLGLSDKKDGRRQYRRVLDKMMLTLALCDETGNPLELLDDTANTLDISLGGLRLESLTELPTNETIAFTFGPEFSTPGFTGLGKIKWSQPIAGGSNKQQKFQSGLAFINSSPRQAIGTHMGLPV